MKEYFSHDYNARNDLRIVKLQTKYGLAGIGAYWCIIEMLYSEGGYLLMKDIDSIAFDLRTDKAMIESIINDFDLFKSNDKKFWSESALTRLKLRVEKSRKASKSAKTRWEKHDANAGQSQSEGNADKEKETKESKLRPENFKNFMRVVSCFDAKFYHEDKWLDCYDKLIRIDKYSEDQILKIVEEFRSDGNWWKDSGNFETLLKLRKNNKEGVKWIDIFNKRLTKNQSKQNIKPLNPDDI